MTKKLFSYCVAGWVPVLLLILPATALPQKQVVRVGVVIDGPWEDNEAIARMTRDEILTLTRGEFDVRFPQEKQITADWTLAGINAALERVLSDPEVDVVLAMGVISSGQVSRRGNLPKPVIAPFVLDADLQGAPMENGTSGVKNLNYLSLPSYVVRDIRIFQEIVPFFKVTILLNDVVVQAQPETEQRVATTLQELEVDAEIVPVPRSLDGFLDRLVKDVEAVYLAPLLHLSTSDWERLVRKLRERKIPSFSMLGIREVERGVLATGSPDIFPRLSRRIALNLQRILLGEEPGALPTAFAIGERIIINMAVAREIGVSPPFAIMTEAVLINEQRKEVARTISLPGVMRESLDKNLDLAAERYFVNAGRQNVNRALANLLPRLEASALGLMIDDDRAAASFGAQAERSLTATLSASQLIFSEAAWANLSIQKSIQKSRELELNQLRLDIVREAATAYLDVLRAKTFERIQKENLKRTRSNWEMAQVREAIGYSGRSEVYRWQSEIANSRNEVIVANSQRNLAEIALNRLLHQPLEQSFATVEPDLGQPVLAASREGTLDYFDDPISFKTFRAFMSEEALANSPELAALDAAIAAKQRELRSATNTFWSPTVGLQFEISHIFKEGGAGTSGLMSPPDVPVTFPQVDETNWSIGLNASLPLFQGSRRFAKRAQASSELEDLRTTRAAVAERIEQRIRSALHVAGASRAGIQLSRDAANAAKRNLDLVTDAYSRGALDILDLLDAQNAALRADLAAANAVYDFMIDLLEVERAAGGFYYLASPAEQDAWFGRLQAYFQQAGVSPSGR